jgi:hypothetical protein
MNRNSMIYHHWLRKLKPGDSVIVIGDLIALSPKYKLFGVCHIRTKRQGTVCVVQEVSGEKIKVADTSFSILTGWATRNSARWKLQIVPLDPVSPSEVKELIINTRGG